MIRGYTGVIYTELNVEQCPGQVTVTRDWATALANRNDPSRVLMFGDVAIIAASIAFRFDLVRP